MDDEGDLSQFEEYRKFKLLSGHELDMTQSVCVHNHHYLVSLLWSFRPNNNNNNNADFVYKELFHTFGLGSAWMDCFTSAQ